MSHVHTNGTWGGRPTNYAYTHAGSSGNAAGDSGKQREATRSNEKQFTAREWFRADRKNGTITPAPEDF